MQSTTRCLLTLACAWAAVAFGATASAGDLSRVLGSVRVEAGQMADEVSTVNGSAAVGAGARTGKVETVNGSITIHERAVVQSVETVNGGVTVEEGAEVRGDVETVNGAIELRTGAQVGGKVANVNGNMDLERATVANGLSTINADIRIGRGSRVSGGILIEKNGGSGWFRRYREERRPRVTIEHDAVVEGPLRFEREVDLYVAPGVTLPPVQGIEPRRHTL